MKIINKKLLVAVLAVSAIFLSACGSSGGSSTPATVTPPVTPPASGTVAGTAATGAPIVGQVIAIDSSTPRLTFAATTSAAGAYTVNVAGGTAPYILTIIGTSGGKTVSLNSVATASGQTVNITPLTDLIVSTAAGQPGGAALATLCASAVSGDQTLCKAALTTATTGTNLSDAVTAVKSMIAPLNTSGADPLNGVFTANGSGMDAVLDQILVTPAPAQGAMATVTLISVPGVQLGTVTMPVSAGGTSTSTTIATNPADITAAETAQTSLSEIRVCLANLSALYPANMTVAPTVTQVSQFIDPSFKMGSMTQMQLATGLSTLPTATAGTNTGMAVKGMTFTAGGFSRFDFSQQTSGTLLTTTSAFSTNSAWILFNWGGAVTSNGGTENVKMIKTTDTAGCPGGWKLAGTGRIFTWMQARINKNSYPTTVYTRQLSFQVGTTQTDAEAIGKIVVTGPPNSGALRVYSGNPSLPLGTATPITLLTAPPVNGTTVLVRQSYMGIQGIEPAEAIYSCQDLALVSGIAGTPCYNEAAVAPGTVFKYTVYAVDGITLKYAYPMQVHAVPLSRAFILANGQDLFAQNLAAVPAGVAALNTAVAGLATGASLDGIIKFTYTSTSVYGAQTNHCGIGLKNASEVTIIRAEQNADGTPTQQTSCTFYDAGLNTGQGSFVKPNVAFGGTTNYMYVTNQVLGNQVVTGKAY